MLQEGIIGSTIHWSSAVPVVPKPDRNFKLCNDFRKLNTFRSWTAAPATGGRPHQEAVETLCHFYPGPKLQLLACGSHTWCQAEDCLQHSGSAERCCWNLSVILRQAECNIHLHTGRLHQLAELWLKMSCHTTVLMLKSHDPSFSDKDWVPNKVFGLIPHLSSVLSHCCCLTVAEHS